MSHSISISNKLYNEIKDYCNLNNIKISSFCEETLRGQLNNIKYGDIPFGVIKNEHINEIPSIPTANEIIPVMPMSMPNGNALIVGMDIKEEANVSNDEKQKEEQKVAKTKKIRVLK